MSCPQRADWVRLLDGEATSNEEKAWRVHLADCARCRAEHDRLARLLIDIAAAVDGAPVAEAVAQVMQAARREQAPLPLPRSRRRWVLGATAAILATLSIAFIWIYPATRSFQPRGGKAASSLERTTGITLYAPPSAVKPLDNGASLTSDMPLVAHWRSLERTPVHLLAFAVDAHGQTHWLYPAYVDRGSDPLATPLPPTVEERVMPESVLLEEPAAGPLRVISLVTRQPLHLSTIERLAPDELRAERLRTRFPGAAITEVDMRLEVVP